jgi:hypothetical protein
MWVMNEMGGAYGSYRGGARRYRVVVGKPEGKRPLGILRHGSEENIKMDLNL